jgi:hypothetical protein
MRAETVPAGKCNRGMRQAFTLYGLGAPNVKKICTKAHPFRILKGMEQGNAFLNIVED